MRIDAEQVAIDIGSGNLRGGNNGEGQNGHGHQAGEAQGRQADIFEAEADRTLVGDALERAPQKRTRRHQNPTPPWAANGPIF